MRQYMLGQQIEPRSTSHVMSASLMMIYRPLQMSMSGPNPLGAPSMWHNPANGGRGRVGCLKEGVVVLFFNVWSNGETGLRVRFQKRRLMSPIVPGKVLSDMMAPLGRATRRASKCLRGISLPFAEAFRVLSRIHGGRVTSIEHLGPEG